MIPDYSISMYTELLGLLRVDVFYTAAPSMLRQGRG